jgi:hypothetical protein
MYTHRLLSWRQRVFIQPMPLLVSRRAPAPRQHTALTQRCNQVGVGGGPGTLRQHYALPCKDAQQVVQFLGRACGLRVPPLSALWALFLLLLWLITMLLLVLVALHCIRYCKVVTAGLPRWRVRAASAIYSIRKMRIANCTPLRG